uniref:Uncharacterized protein n=1 Tax=Strigamia maritima TaxID=126957 RepID=T1IPR6_STRMM
MAHCACTNNQTQTKRNKQMNKKHGLLKNCNILLFANKLLTWMTKHYRKYNEPMKIKMDAALASNCRTMRMCEVLCTLRMCRAFLFANKLLTWMTKHYRKYNEPMKIKMDAALASNCRTMRMCEVLCTLRMCRAFHVFQNFRNPNPILSFGRQIETDLSVGSRRTSAWDRDADSRVLSVTLCSFSCLLIK